ncbi:MAG TPA: cyanophycinase [Thermoanaerobaculia bacterium]|nr:cyanophycinase [Thermoanaerobaculia bacterium]
MTQAVMEKHGRTKAAGKTGKAGTLIIIGGHEDRHADSEVLKAVAEAVGNGKLVVTTVASEQSSEELWEEYQKVFRELGVKKVEHLSVADRGEALSPDRERILEGATAVFFTGGDQLRITAQLGDSLVYRRIQAIYEEGGMVAGTSAGASVMSDVMLVSGNGEESYKIGSALRLAPGLGLLQDVIIDQHFAERGRLGRLLGAVAQNPAMLGVGIDENSAIRVHDRESFEVLGDGAVYVLDASGVTFSNLTEDDPDDALSIFDVKLHVLSAGYCFDLRERRPVRSKGAEEQRRKTAQ